MKYSTLLFDIDDTLIDFKGTEYRALQVAFGKNDLIITPETYEIYLLINHELWRNYEKGLYTKDEILTLRFDLFFVQTGQEGDAAQLSHDFLVAMGELVTLYEETIPLLERLKGQVRLAIVTNGAKLAQDLKVKNSGLDQYFDQIFISDDIGYQKPDQRFFEVVAEAIEGFDKSQTLMIGDSLTSDMTGGLLFGIDTCWFNTNGIKNHLGLPVTYEIQSLLEIVDLIK